LIDGLQQRSGVRDWLEKVGKGTGPQDVGRCWHRRGFGSSECSERSDRSQKSSNLSFHILLQIMAPGA